MQTTRVLALQWAIQKMQKTLELLELKLEFDGSTEENLLEARIHGMRSMIASLEDLQREVAGPEAS